MTFCAFDIFMAFFSDWKNICNDTFWHSVTVYISNTFSWHTRYLLIFLQLIQFSLFCIAQCHKLASEGFNICTHTTPLSQDLTLDQEQLPRNRKKGKKPSAEQQRKTPLPGWTEAIDVMWPEGILTELQHIQWVWQSVWIVGTRHGPWSRPPWSIRQMEVERRSGRGISSAMASDPARSKGHFTRREVTRTPGRKQS